MNSELMIWAEDEARLTAKQYLGLCEDESVEYARTWLANQRVHMHAQFVDACSFDEAREVCYRYDQTLIGAGLALPD